MNCLNGEKYLREAIDSIYSQTFRDWEIIFWNNGSSDRSGEIANSYDSRLKYFETDRTYPLGTVRNYAFAETKGEYVALLDTDDIWLPTKLEKQLTLFHRNPNLGFVFSNFDFIDQSGARRWPAMIGAKRGYVFGDLIRKNFVGSLTIMFNRIAFEGLQCHFRDRFNMVMDYDLCLRIAYYYEIDYVSETLGKCRIHSDSLSRKKKALFETERREMISKLCRDIPTIKDRFKDQIDCFLRNTLWLTALRRWQEGNTSGTRECLKLQFGKNPKPFVAYLCTWFMPYGVFDLLRAFLMKELSNIRR